MNSKKLIASLIVTLFCAFSAIETDAQEWTRKMFKEYTHEFGKVKLGDIPEYRFEIQNIYEEDVRIVSVTSSCGCTVASASKNLLKTWEKGEIICKFNTPAVGTGFKQATITIRFDKPFPGEAQLIVNGNIVGGVTVSPETIDFGQVTSGEFPSKSVTLTHGGSSAFRIVDIKSTFGHISVQKRELSRQPAVVKYELSAKLLDSIPKGFSQGELFIVYEENPNMRDQFGRPIYKQLPISFSAKVGSPVKIAPEILSLGKLKPGEKVTKKVFLTAKTPFRIRDVRCVNSAFSVRADLTPKKVHIVEVTYTGEEDEGKHECELSFFTDLGGATAASGKMKARVEIVEPTAEVGAQNDSELSSK